MANTQEGTRLLRITLKFASAHRSCLSARTAREGSLRSSQSMLIPEVKTSAATTIQGRAGFIAYKMVNRAGARALAIPHVNSYVARYRPRSIAGPRSATRALVAGPY